WHAEDADRTIVLEPAHLTIVRDIAPHQIAALGVPSRALCPQRTGPKPHDRCVWLHILPEERVDEDYVGVPEISRRCPVGAKVARRAGDDARRHPPLRLAHRAA